MNETPEELQVPEAQPKTSKAWMIISIILMVILIGLAVFEVFVFSKSNGDADKIADLEKQLSEKDAKIEEAEKAKVAAEEKATKTEKTSNLIEIAKLKKLIGVDYNFMPVKIEYTKDGKYLYAIADLAYGNTSSAGVWYKSTAAGSEWKELQAGHNLGMCTQYTDEAKKFMETYKDIDNDLGSKYLGCYEDTAGTKIFPAE